MPVHNFDQPRGKFERILIESKALRGNQLGDPIERVVAVSYEALMPEV